MLPADAAQMAEQWLQNQGIQLNTGTTVQKIDQADDGSKLFT